MSEIVVRKFEERDAEAVSRILFDSFKTYLGDRLPESDREPAEQVIRASTGKDRWGETASWVAEVDGKVVGYLCVSASLKRGLGSLHRIGVDPQCYAKGIGSALFQPAEQFWMERKMRKVHTCVSSINERAQAYYKKMGFEVEGIFKDHFFDGVDEIQLAKFYKYWK